MPPEHPQPPRGDEQSSADGWRERPPSRAAQARLTDALRDRAEAYRQDASIDLTIVEALLKLDEAEAAAKTLDDHRASLQAMARDLQVVVADAAVEREAESVCEAVVGGLRSAAGTRPQRFADGSAPAREAGGLRRRALALTGAAAVVIALVLPAARFSPRTTLASVDDSAADEIASARERLGAAVSWARALRAEAAATTPAVPAPTRNAIVAEKVRTILAADAAGGSAARSAAPADVTDLTAYRERRRGSGSAGSTEPDEPGTLDDISVPPVDERVPHPGVPLGADLAIEVESVIAQTDEVFP